MRCLQEIRNYIVIRWRPLQICSCSYATGWTLDGCYLPMSACIPDSLQYSLCKYQYNIINVFDIATITTRWSVLETQNIIFK